MPIFNVRAPDGSLMKISGPEDATDEELIQIAEQNYRERPTKRTMGEAASDVLASFGSGIGQLAQLPGQVGTLAGLYGPKDLDTGLQGAGRQLQEFAESKKTDILKQKEAARSQKIQEQEGFFNEAKTAIASTITDPALLTSFFAEQVPNLVGSFGFGALTKGGTKLLMRNATEQALQKAGVRGAIGGGAIMQGADIGTDTYEETLARLKKNDPNIDPAKANEIALGAGRKAAIEAATISLGASYLPGGSTIERALVGRNLPGATGFVRGTLGETLGEGIEEGGGALAKNLAMADVVPGVDIGKGVGAATGLGALGGFMFGAPSALAGGKPLPDEVATLPQVRPRQDQEPLETLPTTPAGFDAGRAAGLRAEAAQAEQDRLAGIEAGRMAEEQAAQEAVRGMPGFAGAPDINAELIAATRADQIAEQKRLEAERRAQIKQIENTQFSTDPFQDQIMRNRALQQMGVTQETAPAPEPEQKVTDPLAELTQEIPEGPTFKPKAPPKQVPMSPEDVETVKSAKQDLANVESQIAEAKKGGTDLFNRLKGEMSYANVLEIAPEIGGRVGSKDPEIKKKISKYKQLVNTQGQGKDISSMVSDGSLNEYLPPDLRITDIGVDDSAAVQYIYDKLSSGDTRSFDEAQSLKSLEDQRNTLQQVINEPQRRAELNYRAQQAAAEQRGTEPLSFGDLIADAQSRGIDTDSVMERVAMQMPADATPAQYQGAVRNQLDTEIAAQEGRVAGAPPVMEELRQQKEKGGTYGTTEGSKIEKELTGKNFDQLVQWSINNAPNRFNKLVAQKVAAMIKALKAQGVEMQFDLQGGKSRNVKMRNAEGITTFLFSDEGTNVFLQLNGEPVFENQMGYPSGMSYGTIQHELLHVATRTATRWLPKDHPAIKDLNELYGQVVDQYNKDARAGKLPPVLQKYYERRNNALESADELITWGLTDRDFQEYLSSIKVGPKQTAFNKLVSLVRELLGIAKPFETAMEKLVRTTDSILDVDVEVLKGSMQKLGYAMGKAKPPTTQLKQQSLFSKRVQQMLQDDLAVRKNGFYFDAKDSPLYQTRTAEEVGDFSQQEADNIVDLDKRAREIQAEKRWVGKLKDGAWVGVRLDLAVFKAAKKRGMPPVLTIQEGEEKKHAKGFYRGELLKLVPHATLRNVRFNVNQGAREIIAAGGEKNRMASADGQYVDAPPNFDGIAVSFDPRREHLFRDSLGRAVKYADEVTLLKFRAYVRGNVEYYGAEDVPPVPTAPSDSWIMSAGQDARRSEGQIAAIDEGNKVSKEQQESLFNGQNVIQDSLFKRDEGFYIRAEDSPLYQRRTIDEVQHPTMQQAEQAVMSTAKGRRIEEKGVQLQEGQYVGTRLDLTIQGSTGVPVQAIHEGKASTHENGAGFYNGDVLKYAPYVTLRNVQFKINQAYREKIASGIKKKPMGSADGQFVRIDNPNFDGVELRFNPRREHLFVDALGRAVKYAEEITTTGNSIFARGHIEYYGEEDFVRPAGMSATRAVPMQVKRSVTQTGNVAKPIQDELFMRNGLDQQDLFADEEDIALSNFLKSSKEKRILYHGTGQGEIKSFIEHPTKRVPNGYMWGQKGDETYKRAIFLTPDPKFANHFAKSGTKLSDEDAGQYAVYPVYAKIENPFDYENPKHIEMLEKFFQKQYDDWHKQNPSAQRMPDVNLKGLAKDSGVNFLEVESPEMQYAIQQLGFDSFYVLEGGTKNIGVYDPKRIKSALGKPSAYRIEENLLKASAPTPTQLGADSMEMLAGIGRTVAEPEPGYADKVRQSWDNYRDNPQATREAAYGSFRRFADQVETWAFSSDAGLNNQIRREIMNSMVGQEQKIGMLLNTSLSQTAHSDAVSNLFLMEGNIKYDTELHKWVGVKDDNNIINLSKKLDEIAEKNGLTKPEVELLAHTAFEARRTQDLNRFNDQIDLQVAAMKAQAAQDRAAGRPVAASALNDKANNLLKKKKVTTNMSPEALQAGLRLYDMHPGLKEVTKIWNGIRQNALDRMVETGLYTAEEAEMLMSVADYVPFFREEQIEEGKGPKEFLRSLAVQADKRLKGSSKPVNDIFDNMVRWTQYAINRGVRNRSGLALATTAEQMGLADRVQDPADGQNVVRVWEDGKQVYFSMQDPMFVSAFRGLESVSIPTVKLFSKFADVLRQSVVLYPLFSIAQVPQDSFAAMFTSGLKPQHALTIPVRAVKEFIQTLRGKSKAHEELKNVGAVGVRDFTSAIIRADAEIAAGLKEEKGLWAGVKRRLGNLAMAADNAVRQATYEAALAQGLSKAEAIEKAFEIFNVRRRGNSQMLALAGQVIPFFNAYLAAQHVAYRTLTGVGTSPTERKAAFQTLAATTGAVMALSVLYAMMNGDDDDYLNKATPTRDRLLMIPGSGGLGIPLRADIFALPKVLAEHTYLLMTDNGYDDPAKFRASMASLLANSIFSPTPVPQAIKPLAESIMNYDFFQQKPLVGTFQQRKELRQQFEDSTSEFAKVLGSTNMVSPIIADHFIRGMFGSFGGLFLYMTNPILADMAGKPRPSMSLQDAMATIPNASAFVSKEYEIGLRKDFYALKEATDRVGATISDMKTRSPQELADYLSDEDVRARYALTPAVNQIAQNLTKIRTAINSISQAPEERMDEDEKQRQIKQLREAERQLLQGVNIKALRERANL